MSNYIWKIFTISFFYALAIYPLDNLYAKKLPRPQIKKLEFVNQSRPPLNQGLPFKNQGDRRPQSTEDRPPKQEPLLSKPPRPAFSENDAD
jgi:hypothetical protein